MCHTVSFVSCVTLSHVSHASHCLLCPPKRLLCHFFLISLSPKKINKKGRTHSLRRTDAISRANGLPFFLFPPADAFFLCSAEKWKRIKEKKKQGKSQNTRNLPINCPVGRLTFVLASWDLLQAGWDLHGCRQGMCVPMCGRSPCWSLVK
jgi:hypothetical protein